jgi:protein XRP2
VKPHGNAAARRPQPPQNDAKKLSQEEKRALLVKCNAKDLQGEEIVRRPGDITGWDFNCSGLQECKVLIFDRVGEFKASGLQGCQLLVGPCQGSVYLDNCKNCTVIAACQQFRARKLSNCTILLFSHTRPVVESSSNVRFGCFSFGYRDLKAQLDATGLNPLCNPWSQVHVFKGPNDPTATVSYSFLSEQEEQGIGAQFRVLLAAQARRPSPFPESAQLSLRSPPARILHTRARM